MPGLILFIFSIVSCYQTVFGGLFLRRLEPCMKDSPYHFKVDIRTINATHQVANGTYSSKYIFGDNLSASTDSYLFKGNKWLYIFNHKTNNACRDFLFYLREAIYDVQKRVNIRRGCPILPVNFTLPNIIFSFNTGWKFPTTPFGQIKSTSQCYDKQTKQRVFCVESEFEHV